MTNISSFSGSEFSLVVRKDCGVSGWLTGVGRCQEAKWHRWETPGPKDTLGPIHFTAVLAARSKHIKGRRYPKPALNWCPQDHSDGTDGRWGAKRLGLPETLFQSWPSMAGSVNSLFSSVNKSWPVISNFPDGCQEGSEQPSLASCCILAPRAEPGMQEAFKEYLLRDWMNRSWVFLHPPEALPTLLPKWRTISNHRI